jgi:hypothetical protein
MASTGGSIAIVDRQDYQRRPISHPLQASQPRAHPPSPSTFTAHTGWKLLTACVARFTATTCRTNPNQFALCKRLSSPGRLARQERRRYEISCHCGCNQPRTARSLFLLLPTPTVAGLSPYCTVYPRCDSHLSANSFPSGIPTSRALFPHDEALVWVGR